MNLFEIIKEDWINHNREISRPGFRALATHRFGRWLVLKHKNRLGSFFLKAIYGHLYRKSRNCYGIEIPCSVKLGRNVIIEHQGGIVIHGLSIVGNSCIIRQGVTLGNRSIKNPNDAPILGHGVNIGAGAKLLGKIKVGNFSAIGANAVVLNDVPANTTVVGIPAKVLPPQNSLTSQINERWLEWFE